MSYDAHYSISALKPHDISSQFQTFGGYQIGSCLLIPRSLSSTYYTTCPSASWFSSSRTPLKGIFFYSGNRLATGHDGSCQTHIYQKLSGNRAVSGDQWRHHLSLFPGIRVLFKLSFVASFGPEYARVHCVRSPREAEARIFLIS